MSVTDYAGEKIPLYHAATFVDDDGETRVLTATMVSRVTIVITRRGEPIVDETDMAWDDGAQRWYYDWVTTGRDPGNYLVKCTVHDEVGNAVWEFYDQRLNRNRT